VTKENTMRWHGGMEMGIRGLEVEALPLEQVDGLAYEIGRSALSFTPEDAAPSPMRPRSSSSLRWLARGVVEGDEGAERVPAELEGGPAVAAVAALPELAVGETGEQAARGSDKSVGHRR
jgi:hypothetical protein